MTNWTEEGDSELDLWMNKHKDNPANLPDPTNKEQERHEDQFSYEEWRDTGRT